MALTALLGLALAECAAQEYICVRGNDTLRYRYTPVAQPQQDTVRRKAGFLRRMTDYFGHSAEDRTFEKKIDFTFAGGIGYSKDTHVTFGVLAAGLYRADRTDSLTQPSNIMLSGSVSVIGFYSVGATGCDRRRHDRRRLHYKVNFSSAPRYFWGLGHEAAHGNPRQDYIEKMLHIGCARQYRLFRNTYAGPLIDFRHIRGKDFDTPSAIGGQPLSCTVTGLGILLEYDSRDAATEPHRGAYLSLRQTLYPKGLGTCPQSLWKTDVTLDFYRRLWRGGVLGADLHGEFTSGGTPWQLLSRLGGENRMRGYYLGRYTDNHLITAQAELRQHLWRRLGMAVWAGAGNSFGKNGSFDWNHTLPSYGVGLRWQFKKAINIRMDYGFGRHTGGFILAVNEAF